MGKFTWVNDNRRKFWRTSSRKALSIFSAIVLSSSLANADCIVPTITTATSVAANCPGTGEIHIAATGGLNIQYSVISGATSIIGPISSGDFLSLSAGTYVVRAYNPEEGGCFKDTTITIANTYVPFSFTASVASVCAGTTAGTINVTTVPGSSTPLQVAYWQGNANAADATLTYGTTFSHIVPETSFGVWNIRVKDACGEAITSQITVANPYPAGLEFTYMAPWAPYTGIECIGTNPNIDAWVQLKANGIWISSINLPAEGVIITVFDNTDNDCLAEAGEQLTEFTDTISPSTNNDIRIPRNQRLLIRMTTPCGVVDEYCYDGLTNGVPGGNIAFKQEDCPTVTNPDGTVTVQIFVNEFTTVPFTYTLVCSDTSFNTSGSSSTRTGTVSGLPYGATYTVTVTDACGAPVYTQTATAMSATDTLTAVINSVTTENCTYETGKSTVRVQFNGHFPGLSAASTTVTITGGPNAGAVGVRSSDRSFYFYNLVPGTNTVTITNSVCSTSAVLDFTVASGLSTLIQNVGISLDQLCGTVGIGNITINSAYNGSGLPSVILYKVGTSTPIYSGAGGIVTVNNLGEGKYIAKLNVFWPINYACNPTTYDIFSDTVEIMPANSLPNITRKVSMICETPIGSPTEGKVSLEFNGYAPFLLEYKLSASSTWITHDTASTGIELLEGLTPNATYDLRITDKCGNIKTDNVSVGALGAVATTSTYQPCLNQPYTLSVASFANASYTWTKNGIAMSDTTRQIIFPSFTDVNAGAYECTIAIGNCVIRTMNITLYSQLCNTVISTVSLTGNIWNDGNGMTDNMVNGQGTNAGGAVFVVLTDMAGNVLATREVSATGAYSFDNLPPDTYNVLVSGTRPAAGTTMTTSVLSNNWVSTGENHALPTVPGRDAIIDGMQTITVAATNVTNVNFGIERRPESHNKTLNVAGAPVVGVPVVLTTPMTGADMEDNNGATATWNFNPIVITTLPSNGFVLTYDGVVLSLNDTIYNYNPLLLTVTPTATTPAGTTTTVFNYATIDSAGVSDATPATYTVIFGSPLPIKLASFTAMAKGETAILNWATITEQNNSGFEIERSNSNKSWNNIGFVPTKATNGNSTEKMSYDFTDHTPLKGINYYRLKQLDNDGQATYSEERIVRFKNGNLLVIYPNPTTNNVQIDGLEGTELIRVYDVTGRIVYSNEAKNVTETIQLSTLSEGTYQVTITQTNGDVATHKIVKLK